MGGIVNANGVRFISVPTPFAFSDIDVVVPPGGTIMDMLAGAAAGPLILTHGRVRVMDPARPDAAIEAPRELWRILRPKAGMVVVAEVIVADGGDGGKSPLKMVLSIAVMVAGFAVGNVVGGMAMFKGMTVLGMGVGGLVGAAAGAATSMIGFAAVNALIPPPMPTAQNAGGLQQGDPTYTISGAGNRERLWEPVREVFGRRRVYPDLAANSYTEFVNGAVYLRLLLEVGRGPLKLSEWKVGENLLTDIPDVEMEAREGWDNDAPVTLYADDHAQEVVSARLTNAAGPYAGNGWHQRISGADADELFVDISLPAGLYSVGGSSAYQGTSVTTVRIDVEIAPVGSTAWAPAPWANNADAGFDVAGKITITARVVGAELRRSGRIILAQKGQYLVRVRQPDGSSAPNIASDVGYWGYLRTVTYQNPIKYKNWAGAALRIKASEHLNNNISQISCIAEAYCQVYDPVSDAWFWQLSRSPAAAFIKVLTRSKRPVATARLNLDNLDAWMARSMAANANGEPKYFFDKVYTGGGSLRDVLNDICAAGRARLAMPEGKWGVTEDILQTVNVQAITPLNSWGFRETENYTPQPHGLIVRYEDEEADFQWNQVVFYGDGHDVTTATEHEVMVAAGVVRHDQAWGLGAYHMAAAKLRPATYQVHMDLEAMDLEKGKQVVIAYPTILVGLGSARIKSVILNNDNQVIGVVIDNRVLMEAGKDYGVRFRYAAGSIRVGAVLMVKTEPGETGTLTFWDSATNAVRSLSVDEEPDVGDLAMFGEAGREVIEAVVQSIHPEKNLGAMITLLDAAPAVHSAENGPIPARETMMTKPPVIDRKPVKPVIAGVNSDESAMVNQGGGGWALRIIIAVAPPDFAGGLLRELRVKYRAVGALSWSFLSPLPAGSTTAAIEGVVQGVAYEAELTYLNTSGLVSDPATVVDHVVVGKSTVPPNVTDLYLQGDMVRWNYPSPPPDMGGFLVRSNSGNNRNWSNAQPAHAGVLSAAEFNISGLPGGLRTIMVKAVDTDASPNESTVAAVLVKDLGDPVLANVVETVDFKAQGFPGAITNGAVIGGNLMPADSGSPAWTGDDNPAWTGDNNPAWHSVYAAMIYEFGLTPDSNMSDAALTFDVAVGGGPWILEYRPNSQAPAWTGDGNPAWTGDNNPAWAPVPDFIAWPGQLAGLTGQEYRFRITTAAGLTAGVISKCDAVFDVPDLSESFGDIVIPAGGGRLPITRTYRKIVVVGAVAIQADGNGAERIEVLDKDPVFGPLLKAFNGAGLSVAATIDVSNLQGY